MIRIFRHYLSRAYIGLFVFETVLMFLAMQIGHELRFTLDKTWYSEEYIVLSSVIFALVLSLANAGIGLYRRNLSWDDYYLVSRIAISFTFALVVLVILYYAFPDYFIARSVLLFAFSLAFIFILFSRYLFYHYIRHDKLKKRILIIGAGERANEMVHTNPRYMHQGYEIVGCVKMENQEVRVQTRLVYEHVDSIHALALELGIAEIVLATDDRRSVFPMDDLIDCKVDGIDVIDLVTFYEREKSIISLNHIYPSWFVFSDGFANGGLRSFNKRLVDIIASLMILAVSWPFMVLVTLAICLESRCKGPIFYRQTRVGYLSQPFDVIKFRSMRTDAEMNGAQWAKQNDDRVTRVGAFIRKTRLDELPQIWNVIRGEMSFVGPRPERPEFVQQFVKTIPYYDKRHRVKPGITGWAQLCYPYGASEYDALQKLQYDLYYIKNYSLFLDITIILHTIEVILWGKGAR